MKLSASALTARKSIDNSVTSSSDGDVDQMKSSSVVVDYLAHNIKPWVVCEELRDALLIRAISPVAGMMVFDYGL